MTISFSKLLQESEILKKKMGRPKKGEGDSGEEGIRAFKLVATIKNNGKTTKRTYNIGKMDIDAANSKASKLEAQLNKEFKHNADIDVSVEGDGEKYTFKADQTGREGDVEHSFIK